MQARNNKTPGRKHCQNTLDIYCSNAYSDLSHWGRKTKAKKKKKATLRHNIPKQNAPI